MPSPYFFCRRDILHERWLTALCEPIEWPLEAKVLSQCLSGVSGPELASSAQFGNYELDKILEAGRDGRRQNVESISPTLVKCIHHNVCNVIRCPNNHQMAMAVRYQAHQFSPGTFLAYSEIEEHFLAALHEIRLR